MFKFSFRTTNPKQPINKLIFLNKKQNIKNVSNNNKNNDNDNENENKNIDNNIMGPKKNNVNKNNNRFAKPYELDINFYRKNNLDLQHKTDEQLIKHYIINGKKEGRQPNNVDVNYYRLNNIDLKGMSDEQLIKHAITWAKKENRITSRKEVCIIYLYYETKNEQQNQTNLSFFIKYGLDNSRWRNMDITTLFVINGNQCEIVLPDSPDIHLLYINNNYNNNDVELYREGVNYFEKIYNSRIDVLFKKICLVHVNKFGPMYEHAKHIHWLEPLMNNSSIINNNILNVNLPVIDCNNHAQTIFGNYNEDYIKHKLNYKQSIFNIANYKHYFNQTNKKCIVYAHYDKDNIIKQYVLETLVIFAQLGYDILFYTNSYTINNYDTEYLPFKINYFSSTFGSGTDWYMWLYACKEIKMQNKKYEWIALINDSMLVGINGIENMNETINIMENKNYDIWGHWDSNEINYHIMSSFYEFKYNIMEHYINFCEKELPLCKTKNDVILNCETKFTRYLQSLDFKTGVVVEEKSLNVLYNIHTPSHHKLNIEWINNKIAFGVKWKYVINYLDTNNIFLNNEIKEKLRFINIGRCKNITDIFH